LELTILSTTDIHGYLTTQSFIDSTKREPYGYSRTQGLIEKIKAESKGPVLYIDNGDYLQGSPLTNYAARIAKDPSLLFSGLKQHAPDLAVIGNHDFNYGLAYLDKAIELASFPILCANILKDGKIRFGKPYHILSIENLRIGVLGLSNYKIPSWEQAQTIKGLEFISALESCKSYVPLLKDKENCDFIIVSYHGGYERDFKTGQATEILDLENEASAILASGLPIDVLLTGHQHRMEAEIINGIATLQAGSRGAALGKVVLNLEKNKREIKELVVVDTSQLEESQEYLAATQEFCQKTQTWLDQVIAYADEKYAIKDPYLAQIMGHPYFHLINQIQMAAMGTEISANSLNSPDSPGFCGNVRLRDVLINYPHPNTLVNMGVTGILLKEILEKNLEYLIQDDHGKIQINPNYLQPKSKYYAYDIYSGIDIVYDLKKPFGQRIKELKHKGLDIKDSSEIYTVTINNYRSAGGDFPQFKQAQILKEDQRDMQDLIINYLEKKKILE